MALFIIAKRWKQPKCPSADEWINRMWYIHTMECYFTIKKNEILIYATTWMNLENSMLTEISQIQKDRHRDSTYMRYLRIGKFIETK